MAREIKFRAWDKKTKSMIREVFEIGLKNRYDSETWLVGDDRQATYFELMQYTGLKDKNGKEICGGDIVRVNDDRDGDRTYEVIFEKGCYWGNCIYTPRPSTTPQKTLLCDLDYWEFQSKEIIGNIYENPELMGGGNG